MRLLKRIAILACIFSLQLFAEEKTYITCKYAGELGNQMFQIAATVGYALDHNCEPIFPLFSEAASGNVNFKYVFHRLNFLTPNHNIPFEDYAPMSGHYLYHDIPFESGKSIRILGHYQNEKYFVRHSKYIKQLFSPREEVLNYIRKKYGKLEELFKNTTVAVHVRTFIVSGGKPEIWGFTGRAPDSGDSFAGATWDYFIQALDFFPDDYTFLVFSDYPEWTKKHFPRGSKKVKFIEGNPPYIDLYFMSLCHHQIVSPDSTFSWWAAWLNNNPQKTVIVPHYWLNCYSGETIYEGAFPSDWIKIHAERVQLTEK